MHIRPYDPAQDEEALMSLLAAEGEEWSCYTAPQAAPAYRKALSRSLTYVALEDGALCGYSRSLDDHGFYIYVCDLLVRPSSRGRHTGRRLMECLYRDYPGRVVYVMSDVDGYYSKLGYRREGSVFEVSPASEPSPEQGGSR